MPAASSSGAVLVYMVSARQLAMKSVLEAGSDRSDQWGRRECQHHSIISPNAPRQPLSELRVHSREDETFYVVSGIGEFRLDNTTVVRGPGSIIFGPRDVPHTFRNAGDTDLKCLIVYSPGGFEQSFLDIATLGEAGNDPHETGAVLQRYGLTRV